jgi:hypothetical protein
MQVLITGASSGIGASLAKVFAENKFNLVLIARRKDKLEQLKKELEESCEIEISVEALDLSDLSSIDFLAKKYPNIDILINNAGFGKYSAFFDYEDNIDDAMIRLNILVPTLMTKKFGRLMKKGGKIINIASTAGHQPVPYMACYGACKSYLIDFSIGISKELKDISILTYSPGETKTEFQKVADRPKSSILRGPIPDATTVAKDIFKSAMSNKTYSVYGYYNKLLLLIGRFLSKSKIADGIAKTAIKTKKGR